MDDEQAVSIVKLEVGSTVFPEVQRLTGDVPWPLKIENVTYAVCKNTGSGANKGIWSWIIPVPRLYHPVI
jgi:hypothetical protein